MSDTAKLETVPCLCGCPTEGTVIRALDPIECTEWTYYRCPSCDLERLSPRPPITEMERYYPDNYSPFSDPAPHGLEWADWVKRMVYETYFASPPERSDMARRYRPLLTTVLLPFRQHSVLSFDPPPLPRRVFEIGAGTGADLLEFRNAGWEVSGCEPSSVAAATAAARGIRLQVCKAEHADLPGRLSCVYMNNVFEHLHNPIDVLERAYSSLLPRGIVVVIVPNHDSWAARLFRSHWPGYDPPRHIWGYTPRAIRGIFERAGFQDISVAHKYPLSTYCWISGLGATRVSNDPSITLRRRAARALGRSLLAAGFVAAMAKHGDYIRVIARKP